MKDTWRLSDKEIDFLKIQTILPKTIITSMTTMDSNKQIKKNKK